MTSAELHKIYEDRTDFDSQNQLLNREAEEDYRREQENEAYTAFQDAINRAKEQNGEVVFIFNNVGMVATPQMTPESLLGQWQEEVTRHKDKTCALSR
jgi:adenosyl cobinamide kinase/adenosyl cobinamide phosphate guanylyltransferase